jgi:hypothetical protein
MKRLIAATLTAALVLPGLAWGAKVKVWHHHTAAHHDKARFQQAVLSTEGALRLARQVKPFAGLDAAHVWAVAEDPAGNLYAATGNEGKLFKIAADGSVRVVYESEDSQLLCLAVAPDGTVYVGTGPSGQVVRVAPDGTARVFCRTGDLYVWSLALDPASGTLYAGTGPKGRIHAISADGQARVFYTVKQEHVLCVARGPDGQLYAGTGRRGLVYRINPRGKGFVLFDAPQTEVRTLLVTADALYAGTSAPTGRRAPGSGSAAGNAAADPLAPAKPGNVSTSRDDKQGVAADEKESAASASKPGGNSSSSASSESTAPTTPPPSGKENSVYRIAFDGTVREVFRERVMILGLLQQGNRLLIATGGDGQLFEVRLAQRERTELVRVDHTQIHCLCRRADGSIVLGAGDPGRLYVLQDEYAPRGTVTSEVLDAKGHSRWGALRWQADVPPGTLLTVAVRSGNVAEPDETWSEWSDEQADGEHATAASAPPARFLQYRVTLVTDQPGVTPALRSLSIRYMTTNLAPEVGAIEVPDLDVTTLENPKKLKLKWTATDANEDELTYALYYRKDGWPTWVELASDFEKREYEWDTTTVPAGVYQIKVVASDRRDNPEEHALEGHRISAPFVIDHVPPEVTVKVVGMDGDRAVIEATGADALTRLVSAAYAVDSGRWVNVFPAAGFFDSRTETIRFKTEPLKPGTHVLVLRVTDAAGNTGSGDVIFTVGPESAALRVRGSLQTGLGDLAHAAPLGTP